MRSVQNAYLMVCIVSPVLMKLFRLNLRCDRMNRFCRKARCAVVLCRSSRPAAIGETRARMSAVLTRRRRHLHLTLRALSSARPLSWPKPMSHIAAQILDLIKAHPEWAAVLIAFTAFGESFL